MIDTHCHLTFPDFADRPGGVERVLAEAAAVGVTGAITISTTTRDCLDALALARRFPNLWCTAGIHPLYADTDDPHAVGRTGGEHLWHNLRAVAADPRCVAWGELGLDNRYPTPVSAIQRRVLEQQLAFIESCNAEFASSNPGTPPHRPRPLPVVIHCREAFDDLLPVLRSSTLDPTRFVFHCFTGTPDDARQVLDFGAWISFTGVLTYPNAADLRAAAALVPLDRVMVETDAPFLPPVPHRGKRPCLPEWVVHTARALADLHARPFDEMHEQLNTNTAAFFGLAAQTKLH